MTVENLKARTPEYAAVLTAFATHGVERTTMAQLAAATGVSRQTLYKRHGDKEQVLVWAILGFSGESEDRAIAALNNLDQPPEIRLLDFFEEWIGSLTTGYHAGPFGQEVLEQGSAIKQRENVNPRARCWVELNRMLYETGASPTLDDADDRAFTLTTVGKGLLLRYGTPEEFRTALIRILRVCVDFPKQST